jgi:D-alanine-D-alanine ligase
MKITIGVFFGGKSTEHEVSVITGLQALAALDKTKYNAVPVYVSKAGQFYTGDGVGKIEEYTDIPVLLKKSKTVTFIGCEMYEIAKGKINMKKPLTLDVALLCFHGTNVEDGAMQGYFETLGLPYTGCDVLSSAVGMDKTAQKGVLREFANIPVLECVAFTAKRFIGEKDKVLDEIVDKAGLPAIVKPVNLGSSIGIKVAKTREKLAESIEHALLFADKVLAESAVTNLKEINCAVLGDKDSARASECEEPLSLGGKGEILDFEDKYVNGSKAGGGSKNSGMASLKRKIPADITAEQREKVREMAVNAFKVLGCSGVARIDFLMDCDTGVIWFNEINTIPGSLAFYLWESVGVSYSELLDELISLALKRERDKTNLNFSFACNILSAFKGGLGGKGGKV